MDGSEAALFQQWRNKADDLFKKNTCCNWSDLCGDKEPLAKAFTQGITPSEFVSWWIEKHGLIRSVIHV